jgi:hypothetical protein
VFSDEIGWCKLNLQDKNIFFSTGENNIEDLFAMSMCDHHIISHSSFGWWGAWLNKHPTKTVLMPSRHFLSNATYDTMEAPEGWILSKM